MTSSAFALICILCSLFLRILSPVEVCEHSPATNHSSAQLREKTAMEGWKSHVRARLFQRDCTQKDPFSGIFNTLSELADQLDLRDTLWDEVQRPSSEGDVGLTVDHRELYLQLRESEHITEKLSQTVSDLTTVMYLKDAELQYCHSQVSRYRKEAVTQAREANLLQASLSEFEFALASQSEELAALRLEQRELKEGLAAAWREKEELLERWMDEKKEEAERVNRHNDTQERWHRFTRRLNKHHRREMLRPGEQTNSWTTGRPTTEPATTIQKEGGAHCPGWTLTFYPKSLLY
ncbi:uncharacterized protein [Oncorhynchus clarkii lewisi]|uniref:uncharacterized protein isoform X1 n=2 Tax=Oncorhynchus clarkii lewisi TaxID=490388 RepID=UPI0039B8BDBB